MTDMGEMVKEYMLEIESLKSKLIEANAYNVRCFTN